MELLLNIIIDNAFSIRDINYDTLKYKLFACLLHMQHGSVHKAFKYMLFINLNKI
jgi:hypothetical protein